MYRRSLVAFAQQGRTIVRDPRKAKVLAPVKTSADTSSKVNAIANHDTTESTHPISTQQHQSQQQPLPFAPTDQNQSSIGSMVGSYMLAGFGMGLGVILVRIILGG